MTLSYSDQMKKETFIDLVRELDSIVYEFESLINEIDSVEIVYHGDLVDLGYDDSMKESIKSLEILKSDVLEKIEKAKSEIARFEE